jgi:hypothetical protein
MADGDDPSLGYNEPAVRYQAIRDLSRYLDEQAEDHALASQAGQVGRMSTR